MHTHRERVWTSPLVRRNAEKRWLSHYIDLPYIGLQLFSKMDFSPEAYVTPLASHIMG